jgi:hypothetical protein
MSEVSPDRGQSRVSLGAGVFGRDGCALEVLGACRGANPCDESWLHLALLSVPVGFTYREVELRHRTAHRQIGAVYDV